MGGLHVKPGAAPVTTLAFSELEGDLAMWSKAEMWQTEKMQGELAARSWKKRVPAGTRCSDTPAGSRSWTKRWPVGMPSGDAAAGF